MNSLQKKVDLLIELVTSESPDRQAEILRILKGVENKPTDTMENRVADMLIELGVPCRLKGYELLTDYICTVIAWPDRSQKTWANLYTEISRIGKYNMTPSQADRNMRTAIEVAWTRGNVDVFHRVFGNTVSAERGKPTNTEFIYAVADYVRRKGSV